MINIKAESPFGNIYFFRVGDTGPIKIGFTRSFPFMRMQELQKANPFDLKWIGEFRGSMQEEAALHRRFARSRIRGEWYQPTDDLLCLIAAKSPDFDGAAVTQATFFIYELELIQRAIGEDTLLRYELLNLVRSLNGDTYEFSLWKSFNKPPSRKLVAAAMQALEAFAQRRILTSSAA
jgi:hypothetical protein